MGVVAKLASLMGLRRPADICRGCRSFKARSPLAGLAENGAVIQSKYVGTCENQTRYQDLQRHGRHRLGIAWHAVFQAMQDRRCAHFDRRAT
jgi:hypothetical protein